MSDNVTQFYSELTPFYHLIYPDWETSFGRQANTLDQLIRENWPDRRTELLDAACGIGTQSLGLAKLGYQVTASDLSPDGVKRASLEAADRGLVIPFTVADMRALSTHHQRQFDIVLACDNAIPHLLSDDEILRALRQLYACTRPGGGCIISTRDYEAEDRTDNSAKFYGLREDRGVSYLIFQKWAWRETFYDLTMYVVEDDGDAGVTTHVMRSVYYAISTTRLMVLMIQAGFRDVARLDEAFFQPVIIGTRTD